MRINNHGIDVVHGELKKKHATAKRTTSPSPRDPDPDCVTKHRDATMLTALESDYSEQHVKHHMQPPAHRGQLRQYHARSLRYTGNMLGSTMTTALVRPSTYREVDAKAPWYVIAKDRPSAFKG